MANFTLFCGLPGSGKTTLAKALEARGQGLRLCTDEWQACLRVDHSNEAFHELLQKRLYELSLELLSNGLDVILEDGLWRKPERLEKLSDARRVGATVEQHLFLVTFDELWRRLSHRNSRPSKGSAHMTRDQLTNYWSVFETPDKGELALFDKVVCYRDDTPSP